MRIITGEYKGRHFDIPRTFKARPTTDFAKENIFKCSRVTLTLKMPLPSTFSQEQEASPWNSFRADASKW